MLMQVSKWMLGLWVGPTGKFYLMMFKDYFCIEYYKQFIFVIIEHHMDFIIGALK